MKILLTRAAGPAERSSRKLLEAGHRPVVLPLFELVVGRQPVPKGNHDAVIFTSAAAPEILTKLGQSPELLDALRRKPAYCVGAATVESASAMGFSACMSADANGERLAQLIALHMETGQLPPRPRILYPAARHRTHDFAKLLPATEIDEFTLYESVATDPGRTSFVSAVAAVRGGAAFLYSSRSCRHFFGLSRQYGQEDALLGLTLVGISEKVAQVAPAWARGRFAIANSPNEPAMIAILGK